MKQRTEKFSVRCFVQARFLGISSSFSRGISSSSSWFAARIMAIVVLYFFGEQVSLLFVDAAEQEILHNSWLFLTINAAFYLLLALVNIVRFTIQGMGFSYLAILAGVCEMVARSVV